MANYDYYVDENGKITRKKKKKEEDNIAYVVSEDGTISPYQDRKTAIRESAEPLMDGLKTVGRVTGAVGESMWKGIIGPSLGKMAIGYVAAKQAEKEREEEYPIAAALSNVTQAMGTVGGAVKDFGVGVAATSGDVAGNVVKGFLGGAEGVSDFLSNGVAGVADWIGFDEYAEDVRDRTAENMYGDFIDGLMDDWGITEHSSLGGIPEQVAQGVGQAGFTVATGAFGKMLGMGAKGVSWLSNGTLFASSAGNGMSQAYRDGATDGEAFAYGVTQGTIEVLTERLFGDLGKWTGNAGLGKSFSALDDKAAKAVGQKVAKALGTGKYANAFKNVVEGTVKAGFGGAEEAIAGAGSSVAKWLIYASEEKSLEELAEIVQDENLLEQFIVGALVSGVMQTPDVVKSSKDGTDLISGRTNDEDAVFNKEYEKRIAEEEQGGKKLTNKEKAKIYEAVERDFAEGGISIDTIEETLGGDTYTEYQNAVNEQKALQDEFDTLNKMKQGEMTGEQSDRRNELKQQLDELKNNSKADEIRQRLSEEVKTLVTTPSKSGRNSPLAESYNERERRKHKFVANLSDYDDDEKETIQRAIDSGILNNTRQTHKFVDLLAKLSADKGVSFDFTNNEKLKESGFAVDGRQVNGYVTVNGVTVNINSNKALNSVVGHEITHVLEGTNLYPELQNFLKQYAESKGEYQSRVDAITKLYEGLDADIDAEVTADLVGDYLFTDPDFVRRLSVEHRNVFQKVYDEIKYLAKVATAGSKQARQLEKAMKTFEDIYRESGKAQKNTVTEDGVKYDLADVEKITPSDEQKNANIYEVAEMEAVYTVDESKLSDSGKKFSDIYNEYFTAWGGNIHSDVFGDIAVKNSSIRSEIRHGSTAEKIAAIEAIPSVIENGKVVEWMEKAEGSFRIVVAAPIRIGNSQYYMGVMLQRDSQYQRLYLHDVVIEKEASELSQDHLVTTGPHEEKGNLFTTSILQKILDVKGKTDKNSTNVRNSLSNEGDIEPPTGTYNVYGKDIALEDLPIREDIAKNATVDDLAPVQDTVQPTVQDTVQESVFPDDFTPTTEAEANALADESLDTFTDEDAPPMPETEYDDFSDTTALDPKALKDISKALKDVLYLNNKEVKAIGEVVQKYSTTEFPDKADLFDELQAKFGQKESVARNEETAAIKKTLREYPINVSQAIKKDITDYGAFMRRNFGKVRFSKEGVPVDTAYQDLSSMFPGYFPADITNASDQLMRIAEVAGMEINETETFTLSDEDIMEAVDVIEAEVGKYKEAQVQASAEADRQAAFAHIDDIAPVRDDIAPAVDIPAAQESAQAEKKPIKTVQERIAAKLENTKAELESNKRNRAESAAAFEEEISHLYEEYSAKKNKNTKAAQDILRRIDRRKTMQANIDADYAKRISDLEAKVAQLTEEVENGDSPTEQRAMRAELHAQKIEDIKNALAVEGLDIKDVLSNAKNLSSFSTVDNTPQRVMEKTFGVKAGRIIADQTVNKVAENETKAIEWQNGVVELVRNLSKDYGIKPRSKESAAAQMYAEGFYENAAGEKVAYGDAELAKDFPNVTVQARIKALAADPRIRQFYDETLAAINESRVRNGYAPIKPLKNYFLHFREMGDFFSKLGIPFNPNAMQVKDLPTDMNGNTADLKPGQPFFASGMHRKGWRTTHDILGGIERYGISAAPQMFHIDDIQTFRALRNFIADGFGQAKGFEGIDDMDAKELKDHIQQVLDNHLTNFAAFLNEEANVIAGKTALIDRGFEGLFGRKGLAVLKTVNQQTGANQVGFNVSSAGTNFLSVVQAAAKLPKRDLLNSFVQFTTNKIKSIGGQSDGFAEQSPVIIRRKGADRFNRTAWQKTTDAAYWLMGAVDNVSTEIIARGRYNELTRKGMDAQQAHQETDKWVSRLMGDRSLGQQPLLYNSQFLGIFTKYQLEVRNQLDSQFYDTIKDAEVETEYIENQLKRNSKKAAKITSVFLQLAIGQHLFGKAFESIAGYNPAFDIISVLIKTFGWDDDEDDEDTALDNIEQGFLELLGDLPYTSTFTGGRIPISSALPVEQFVTGKDQYGNEKSRWETVKEAAPYYLLPGGYGQIKKTTQGLSMFSEKDKPSYYVVDEDGNISENFVTGSYTDSGNLRYPVEKTFGNVAQAALFGQYANKNAREYFDDDIAPLKENQIVEYDMLDIPIADYWKYRKGLAKKDTLEEKLDYIDDLDLPIDKKNIMANNVANRESYVDLTDYDDFSGLDEFDFATKNPEKYEFFEKSGITYAAYANGDEDAKRAYNWAYENPEKYIVSQAVASDVVEYRKWASELNDLTGDKDEDGKTINGSRKEKVIDYINHMDADYGAKIILFRTQYKSDDTYNSEIVEYLNNRDDITYDEMVTILQELDFKVYPDGTVEW